MSTDTFICPKCEQTLEGGDEFFGQEVECPQCQHVFTAEAPPAPSVPHKPLAAKAAEEAGGLDAKHIAEKLSGHLTSLAGVEKLEGFSLKELFGEVFRKHSKEEMEEYFTVGTPATTPLITDVDTTWPRPWVFFKTFIGALIVYILFLMGWNEFENINLIPGLIIMGSFAVPIATLIFFVEINARQNVSLYQVIRLLFTGGILSLIISLLLFEITDALDLNRMGESISGKFFVQELSRQIAKHLFFRVEAKIRGIVCAHGVLPLLLCLFILRAGISRPDGYLDLGRPRTRSPRMFLWISLDPAAIVLPYEFMYARGQCPPSGAASSFLYRVDLAPAISTPKRATCWAHSLETSFCCKGSRIGWSLRAGTRARRED